MKSEITVTYNGTDPDSQSELDLNIRLEQEEIPDKDDAVRLGDLGRMWAKALNGDSAFEHVFDTCPYAVLQGDTLVIKLNFHVFPSVMDLPYELSTGFGDLSDGERYKKSCSFYAIMDDTDNLQLDDTFSGSMVEDMPVFNSNGEEINPVISLDDTVIRSSEPCITALRMDGFTEGYKHTLTMRLTKFGESESGEREGYNIENLTNHVTAKWVDENGEDQKTTVGVKVPSCVEQLLEMCEDDLISGASKKDITSDRLVVYYNTCTGEIVEERKIEGNGGSNDIYPG